MVALPYIVVIPFPSLVAVPSFVVALEAIDSYPELLVEQSNFVVDRNYLGPYCFIFY